MSASALARKNDNVEAGRWRGVVRIDAPDFRAPRDFGPKPQVVWLDVVLLRIDDLYQRPIDKAGRAQIIRIAELFDWRKFAPLVVAETEGGLYAIVDGQHRAHAAALCNIRSVPCYIISASVEEQADCFAAINGQVTAIRTVNLWKAKRAAGDPEALAVAQIAEAEGVEIVWHNLSTFRMAPHQTCAINAIARVRRSRGDTICALALFALRATKVSQPRSFLTAQWIEAAATALEDHPEIRDRKLIAEKLGAVDLAAEEAENREMRIEQPELAGWALCIGSLLAAFGIAEGGES